MSVQPAEPDGLPVLAAGMILACVVLMVTTNRKFGHATFHNNRRAVVGDSTEGRRSTSSKNSNTHGRHLFEGLPELGVLETITSFLSPADLVGIATVSAEFCRASASSLLWRCHCERAFGASNPQLLLGGDWRRAEHERRDNRFQHQHKQDGRYSGRRGRLLQKQPGEDTAAVVVERRCGCDTSRSKRQHQCWPTTEGGGNGGKRASLASHFRRCCSEPVCPNYSWREAFFRAHRAKPRDLLRELSPSPSSTSTPASHHAQQPPPPRPCIVILHGRVHDLTEFLQSHPGGSLILQEHAFTDATPAFER